MAQPLLSEDAQKELQEKLQHLVDLAFEKGLVVAIDEARKLNDPYLLDAFHDMLTDKLYQELVAQHKLEELK
ncbi:MAG: hypothetical protein NUV61_02975 [Candidatus Azambacteria bacterium]|nr:hypothetical protein [Candidatus Azambacteria bacterium]